MTIKLLPNCFDNKIVGKIKAGYRSCILPTFPKSCFNTAKWHSKTSGTKQPGSKINGKYKMAILGWSKANFCNGDGVDKTACTTTFIKSNRQIKFQAMTKLLFICFLT